MTIYDLKPAFQRLLRPICSSLAKHGVTANQVTILAITLSFLTGTAVWVFDAARWTLFLIPAMLFVRMALNAIDGMLAREHNMSTALGAVLNELGDVASDVALYLPFAVIPDVPNVLLVLVVVLAVFTELTGVIAVQIGAQRRYDGPMGKSDRAFVFGILALLIGAGVPTGRWLTFVFGALLLLAVLTIVNRAHRALKEIAR